MDCEAIDKDMSSWVVTQTLRNTRFFISQDGYYTDILSRAKRFRYLDLAEMAAQAEIDSSQHGDWRMWRPISVAEAIADN